MIWLPLMEVSSFGVWRSLVARFVRDEEAVGSNPATPTDEDDRRFIFEASEEGGVEAAKLLRPRRM